MSSQVTTVQCLNKWKNLLKSYKCVLDNVKKGGKGAIRFQFFDNLYEIVGDKPGVTSQISEPASELSVNTSNNEVIIETHTVSESQQQQQQLTETTDLLQKFIQTNSSNKKRGQLTAFVYDYFARKEERQRQWEEEREQRYEEKEKRREERHKKKMELEQKKLQLLSELLKK